MITLKSKEDILKDIKANNLYFNECIKDAQTKIKIVNKIIQDVGLTDDLNSLIRDYNEIIIKATKGILIIK